MEAQAAVLRRRLYEESSQFLLQYQQISGRETMNRMNLGPAIESASGPCRSGMSNRVLAHRWGTAGAPF